MQMKRGAGLAKARERCRASPAEQRPTPPRGSEEDTEGLLSEGGRWWLQCEAPSAAPDLPGGP